MREFDTLRQRMLDELKAIGAKDSFCRCDLDDALDLIRSLNGLKELNPHGEKPTQEGAGSEHLTMDQAKKWVGAMQNADGTTGPHWSYETAFQLMSSRKITCHSTDFWVTLCMMYSDYCAVAKEYGADTPAFYADMAAAFLHDKDAVDNKLVEYWEHIPAGR